MHTARTLLQQVRRALVAVALLGAVAALLQLVVPLCALHAIDGAIARGSVDTLALLLLVAACATAVLACIAGVRDRIVLRAALWLDHTLGRHLLDAGLGRGSEIATLRESAVALSRVTQALSTRAIMPVLDAPWLPLALLALAVLHPLLGAVAAFAALLLVLAAVVHAASLTGDVACERQAAAHMEAWWHDQGVQRAQLHHGPVPVLRRWEGLSRAHVAAAYALGRRGIRVADLARMVEIGAPIALMSVGAWLVIRHELSIGAAIAAALIQARLLQSLGDLLRSLGTLGGARSAYRSLKALPDDAADPAPAAAPAIWADVETSAPRAAVPRLNVRGPLAAAVAAILLFLAGVGAMAMTRLSDIAELTGHTVFEGRLATVPYPRSGVDARLHVKEGAVVRTGDLLVTLDTAALDRQIAALKARAEAARGELALVSREALGMAAARENQPIDRPKLAALERRIAQLQSEAQDLVARIAIAEEDLARSEIRAPVAGRVVSLGARGHSSTAAVGTPAPGMTLLEIAIADRPLLARLLDPLRHPAQRLLVTVYARAPAAGAGRGS